MEGPGAALQPVDLTTDGVEGFTKREKVRDGLEIPTACFRDAPSHGS